MAKRTTSTKPKEDGLWFPDSPAAVRVYRKITNSLWPFRSLPWGGSVRGRPAEEVYAETLFLDFQELKRDCKQESSLYLALEEVLGDFLRAGLNYGREDFLGCCQDGRLRARIDAKLTALEELDSLVKKAETKAATEVGAGHPAAGGAEPSFARYLGGGKVQVGTETVLLAVAQTKVIEALIHHGALTGDQLRDEAGIDDAVNVLKRLKRHPLLGPYIKSPGAARRGGYRVSISRG